MPSILGEMRPGILASVLNKGRTQAVRKHNYALANRTGFQTVEKFKCIRNKKASSMTTPVVMSSPALVGKKVKQMKKVTGKVGQVEEHGIDTSRLRNTIDVDSTVLPDPHTRRVTNSFIASLVWRSCSR